MPLANKIRQEPAPPPPAPAGPSEIEELQAIVRQKEASLAALITDNRSAAGHSAWVALHGSPGKGRPSIADRADHVEALKDEIARLDRAVERFHELNTSHVAQEASFRATYQQQCEAIHARILADVDPAALAELASTAEALRQAEAALESARAELKLHDRTQATSNERAAWQRQRRDLVMAIDDATAERDDRASAYDQARALYVHAEASAWGRAVGAMRSDHDQRKQAAEAAIKAAVLERDRLYPALELEFRQLLAARMRLGPPELTAELRRSGQV